MALWDFGAFCNAAISSFEKKMAAHLHKIKVVLDLFDIHADFGIPFDFDILNKREYGAIMGMGEVEPQPGLLFQKRLFVFGIAEFETLGICVKISAQQRPQHPASDNVMLAVPKEFEPFGLLELVVGEQRLEGGNQRKVSVEPAMPQVYRFFGNFESGMSGFRFHFFDVIPF